MTDAIRLMAPCHFGMEAVLKRELGDLGLTIDKVEDGRVTFFGDERSIARANIGLRTAERILWVIDEFHAETFDGLFEAIKAIPWEDYLPLDGRFWVTKATSVDSKLFSPRDIQRIVKKAMVERMKLTYPVERFTESGADYPLRISIRKDRVTVGLDTTGESLHKRGYRKFTSVAPLSETLASAILLLSPWKADRILVDPFCGSGTVVIEAAMMARHIAPGLKRTFLAEGWPGTGVLTGRMASPDNFLSERQEAESHIIKEPMELSIQGYDIDDEVLHMARENARLAGVDGDIHLQRRDVADFSSSKKYGFVITNPPYGERLSDVTEMTELYRTIGDRIASDDTWSWWILSGYENAQRDIGKKATKNRKIYNGMLKTYLYQYMGQKPPRRKSNG